MTERITSEALVAALTRNEVIPADAVAPPRRADSRPWFISALQGMAAWLAGVFALVSIIAGFEPRESVTFGLLGALLLSVAFGLYKAGRNSVFLDQLALAISIAGQLAAAAALAIASDYSASLAFGGVAVLQCVLVVLMPNRLARSLATFFACVAWALTVRFLWWGEQEVWVGTTHPVSLAPALIGWAVIWIPVAAICLAAIAGETRWMSQPFARIVRPALSGMLLALTFGTFASEPLAALVDSLPSGRTQENWLALWPLLNATAALFAGFAAFHLRNKAILGTAIVAALLHVGQFYSLLGTTLVVKSIIMFAIGAILLAAGILLTRRGRTSGEATA